MLTDQNTVRKSIGLAWVLLSVGLIATIITTIYVKMDVDADARREFNFACSQIQLRIDARINAHEQILISAAALFDASDEVTREKWHAYTLRQNIAKHLPGIQGIGFSLVIPREELEQHIQEIRSQGFPDYNVKPEGDRPTYTSIIYLEPFSGGNLQAFGYDMFSEPVRRTAMERSRDVGVAVLSGKVLLVEETDQDVQAGVLMYVPVYRKGMMTDTLEHRRAALYGWVYSPYPMKDMMQGILRGWSLEPEKQIRLQIFDNERWSADSLLYDSQPSGEIETVNTSQLTLQMQMAYNDHIWSLRFTQTDGHWVTYHVYGVFFAGTIISLVLFGLHFSLLNTRFRAQQSAEQLTVAIRESEEKYRIIFNNDICAICIFDLETLRLLEVNDACSRVYGYSREELISGMTIHDITAERQVSEAATTQAIHEAERSRWERQRQQLEKAESLNRMAGAIAHHFNNQLYVVIGNLELVLDDLPAGSDESQKLLNAMKASNKAVDVSRLMLTYLGQTPGKPKLLDLSETCSKELLMLQSVIPKSILIETVFPLPGPTICANMSQMHQIFTNLVTNAWESISEKKGTITLSVKTVSATDISLSHHFPIEWQPKEPLYACLEVADTGSGITNEDIEKIFDPFFTTKFVGRGLGLAALLGIVSAHGGGITVESEVGRGSIFRIFLPVAAEAVSVSLEAEKATQMIESGTVLVIEDEPDVRHMVSVMLSRIGFTVIEATDGVEAMEIFSRHQDTIHLVLSDLSMPRMDGWDTISALRNISPEIPVILSSGYDEAQVMTEEHPDIPDAYLGKPYQLRVLRETINRVLTKKHRQDSTPNDIHILFVDDEPDTLKAIRRLISRENYRQYYAAHFAGSGAEALAIMAKLPIQIIVTDLKMPEMDGIALLGQVKERYPDTVRMAISAYLEIDLLLHCINTGEIFRYVTKPTTPEELKQALQDAINYYRAQKTRTDIVLELQEKNEKLQEVLEQEW